MSGGDDLSQTIERIRRDRFADLPAELVSRIVSIESRNAGNRVEAFTQIRRAIDEYLSNKACETSNAWGR